ncbi:dual specificity protein phosphatase 6-like [Babylonia areolata]|uniref:dual specificity protein phosphatase 6-like n=1 Tax=Babylonia areolata TaxID=304850 RepID=UPI003FD12F16
MPSLELLNVNEMSCDTHQHQDCCFSPERLLDEIRGGSGSGNSTVVIVDCRPQADFVKAHIRQAINISLPSLMQKRLKRGSLNLSTVIQNNEAKERFSRCCKSQQVVMYDECTTDLAANPSSVLSLLVKKLRQDGGRVAFLIGGFSTFQERFPEYCQTQEQQLTDNTILGLCNLRISDDSAYGSCESSGDLESTPHMSPFPVEVLPYLYLGNAKNSADLSQLKKNGIHYILNVTPNVPNMFQDNGDFKYLQIPISDHWSQNLSSFFPEAIAFIDEARQTKQGVLVHCLAGISRSVTVTVAYLMSRQSMCLNEAYDFVKRCKPNISPNFTFMGQLLDYEKALVTDHPDHPDHHHPPLSPSPSPSPHHLHHHHHHHHLPTSSSSLADDEGLPASDSDSTSSSSTCDKASPPFQVSPV